MESAGNRQELIKSTNAIIGSPRVVRMAGSNEVTLGEFEHEVESFVSLTATDKESAARAVRSAVERKRKIISP